MKNGFPIIFTGCLVLVFSSCTNEKPKAVAEFDIYIDRRCSEDSPEVTFENRSEHADSYLWDFGDGTISDDASPVKTYQNSGNYAITLTASNSESSSVSVDSLLICLPGDDGSPKSDFELVASQGNSGAYTLINKSSNAIVFAINYGDGSFEMAEDFDEKAHQFPGPGVYSIWVEAFNSEGCSCYSEKTLTIQP